jgi:hypothetical protein
MAVKSRKVQWRSSLVVHRIDIGALGDELLDLL